MQISNINAILHRTLTIRGAARQYRLSYQQVYQWARKYRQMGKAGLQDRRGKRIGSMPSRTPEEALRDRVADLEYQNRMLRIERDVLKKCRNSRGGMLWLYAPCIPAAIHR
ncbi:helix-turn-helix domain-containing protein [Mitsuokella jalaludinii]|uniref:helix-turn-helix domain-containing protein n=1 Tax=Mitsuokella jalaludinii TaxID=187979 RepID=UPI003F9435BF